MHVIYHHRFCIQYTCIYLPLALASIPPSPHSSTPQPCEVDPTNPTRMQCPAPRVSFTNFSMGQVSLGLLMDRVTDLLMINATVTILPDPAFSMFSDVLEFAQNENIQLTIHVIMSCEVMWDCVRSCEIVGSWGRCGSLLMHVYSVHRGHVMLNQFRSYSGWFSFQYFFLWLGGGVCVHKRPNLHQDHTLYWPRGMSVQCS